MIDSAVGVVLKLVLDTLGGPQAVGQSAADLISGALSNGLWEGSRSLVQRRLARRQAALKHGLDHVAADAFRGALTTLEGRARNDAEADLLQSIARQAAELLPAEDPSFPGELMDALLDGDPAALDAVLWSRVELRTGDWMGNQTKIDGLAALAHLKAELPELMLQKFSEALSADEHRRAWNVFIREALQGFRRSLKQQHGTLATLLSDLRTVGALAEQILEVIRSDRKAVPMSIAPEILRITEESRARVLREREYRKYRGRAIQRSVNLLLSRHPMLQGRSQAYADLEAFLSGRPSGYLCLTGETGVGKTALLANWIQDRQQMGDAVAYHVFSAHSPLGAGTEGLKPVRDAIADADDPDRLSSVDNARVSLLCQLCALHGLTGDDLDEYAAETHPDRRHTLGIALQRLVQELGAPADAQRLLIVIDALDEAEVRFSPPFDQELPNGVYVVVSSRAGTGETPPELVNWMPRGVHQHLGALPPGSAAAILRSAAGGALADLAREPELVAEIEDRTAGSPLYIRYLIEDLADARREKRDLRGVLLQAPTGFAEYVDLQLDLLARSGLKGRHWRLLALTAVAERPIPKQVVASVLDVSRMVLDSLLTARPVARWLEGTSPRSESLSFGKLHVASAFARASRLHPDADKATIRLLEYCERHWRDGGFALEAWGELLIGAHRRAVESKDRAGATALEARLHAMLTNVEVLEARVSVDCHRLHLEFRTCYAELGQKSDALMDWYRFFENQCQRLSRGPARFIERALDEPLGSAVSSAAEKYIDSGDAGTFLRRVNRTTTRAPIPRRDWRRVVTLGWTDAGPRAVCTSGDGTIQLVDPLQRASDQDHSWGFREALPRSASITTDGCVLLGTWHGRVGMLCRDDADVQWLKRHRAPVHDIGMSEAERGLISVGGDGLVAVSSTRAETPQREVKCRQGGDLRRLAVASDSVAVVDLEGTIALWNWRTGRREPFSTVPAHGGFVSVAISANGSLMAGGTGRGSVFLWNLKSGEPCERLLEHAGPVRSVSFSPDEALLAAVSDDGFLRVWELFPIHPISSYRFPNAPPWACAAGPNGSFACVDHEDEIVVVRL